MPPHNLTRFPRLEFIGAPTPLEYLPRFSVLSWTANFHQTG